MRYGYIRVSTKEQNIDRQLTAILKEKLGWLANREPHRQSARSPQGAHPGRFGPPRKHPGAGLPARRRERLAASGKPRSHNAK